MSAWNFAALIAAIPLALVAGLCGLANLALAGLWLYSGKDSPSGFPLIGSAAGLLLLATAMLLQPGWIRDSAVLVAVLGIFGESSLSLVGAFISARRRRRARSD